MTHVSCAQFRYTWAKRRLGGIGGGFGVVLQSADWPSALLDDPALSDLLTNIAADVRQESPETATAVVTHLRLTGGSLLVAKRPVGQDGAGRPGNYAVHALLDPTGTLGSLDLEALVAGGTFVLERDVDIEPRGDAPTVTVWAPPDWRSDGMRSRPVGPESAPAAYGDEPLRYRQAADVPDLLRQLCRRLPADLVNQLQLDRAEGGPGVGTARSAGAIDQLIGLFDEAVELGVVDQEMWWERRGDDVSTWLAATADFVTMNQPIRRVPDKALWARWDAATARGRTMVVTEILSRSALADDPAAVAELSRRPVLLGEVLEAGIRGQPAARTAAAAWVTAAGDDDQVVELAAELLHAGEGERLPKPVLDRLQRLSPERLPAVLVDVVATHLDGAEPLDPFWRSRCLQLRLAGLPTCVHPEQLLSSSSDANLAEAVAAVIEDGTDLDTCWAQLAPLTAIRRARLILPLGAFAASFLLRHELSEPVRPVRDQLAVWPSIGRALGWAEWSRRLPVDLARANRQLRAQRFTLLILVGLLAAAVIVLAILL